MSSADPRRRALEQHVLDEVRDAARASAVSWRDPRVSHTPMLTERTCGIDSVTRRRPLSRTSRTIMVRRERTVASSQRAATRCEHALAKSLTEKELPSDRSMIARGPANSIGSRPPERVRPSAAWYNPALRMPSRSDERERDQLDRPPRPGRPRAGRARGARSSAAARRRFHARQIFRWIYRRGVTDFGAMTDLARPLRATLAAELRVVDAAPSPTASARPTAPRSSCSRSPTAGRSSRSSSPTRRRRPSASRRRSAARWRAPSA